MRPSRCRDGVGVGISAPNDPVMVFGSDAGVLLTFVTPDKTDDFERVVDRSRTVLEESDDPIRQQQRGNWRIFRSPDPGPAGSVLYVSFMEPVLKSANYGLADILAEELQEDEAEELISLLEGAFSQSQSVLNLESIIYLSDELPPSRPSPGKPTRRSDHTAGHRQTPSTAPTEKHTCSPAPIERRRITHLTRVPLSPRLGIKPCTAVGDPTL
jgi:hypothetical protein